MIRYSNGRAQVTSNVTVMYGSADVDYHDGLNLKLIHRYITYVFLTYVVWVVLQGCTRTQRITPFEMEPTVIRTL